MGTTALIQACLVPLALVPSFSQIYNATIDTNFPGTFLFVIAGCFAGASLLLGFLLFLLYLLSVLILFIYITKTASRLLLSKCRI